jgi:tartrate dehydratase beta subunit/fumarate hydratase class I family protein
MKKLNVPFTEEKIRALKVGDEALISGVGFTGRGTRELQTGEYWV